MLSARVRYLLLAIVSSLLPACRANVRIGIVDDVAASKQPVKIKLPNRTLCGQSNFHLQLHWLDAAHSLPHLLNRLESDKELTHVYIARTTKFSTQLIRDFCEMNRIPFVNMQSYGSKTMLCSRPTCVAERAYRAHVSRCCPFRSFAQEYFVTPDTLRVLFNYLKFNHVHRAIYIYDNEDSTHRIYELLKLMNNDEYFSDFVLDVRTTLYEDIYSLLYSIESHSLHKDQVPRYILLDLHSFDAYETMFDKISHMGSYRVDD